MKKKRFPSAIKDISIQKAWMKVPSGTTKPEVTRDVSRAFRPSWANTLALGSANWQVMETAYLR